MQILHRSATAIRRSSTGRGADDYAELILRTHINIIVLSQRRHPPPSRRRRRQSSFALRTSPSLFLPWIYPAGFADHIRGGKERRNECHPSYPISLHLCISLLLRSPPPTRRHSALDPIMVPMKIISPSLNDFLLLIASTFLDKVSE